MSANSIARRRNWRTTAARRCSSCARRSSRPASCASVFMVVASGGLAVKVWTTAVCGQCVDRPAPAATDSTTDRQPTRTRDQQALHDGPDRQPWLVYLFFALIVIGPIAVARWSPLDELLADRRTLAELNIAQTARWLGCVFLVLEVGGQLPGFFAYPAGFGDIAVGLTASVAVITLIWSTSASIPVA
jgi:hypothetical protein